MPEPGQPFTIIAELESQPGRGDEIAAAVAASGAVGLTRLESGCNYYEISRDMDAPDRFVALESWRDLEALRLHLTTAHFATVSAALGGLLAGAPAIRILIPVPEKRCVGPRNGLKRPSASPMPGSRL